MKEKEQKNGCTVLYCIEENDVKDKEGRKERRMLKEKEAVMGRWREYFEQLQY